MAATMATRSISISLDERLLRDLDQELSQGGRADLLLAAQPLVWRQQAARGWCW
ncbi:MAG: hypothetical protein RLZZ247_696 [Cyanobacteriota bacterium]